MAGKHAAPDRRRLYREMLRLILLLVFLAVALVGGAVGLNSFLDSPDDVIPVSLTDPANTSTSVLDNAIATISTTTIAPTTTTIITTTTTIPPPRDPNEVTVLVLNSTETKGMAGRLTATLNGLGYITIEPDNYSPSLGTSTVWFLAGYEREAEILAANVSDATVEANPDGSADADITVVIGASFSE